MNEKIDLSAVYMCELCNEIEKRHGFTNNLRIDALD